MDPRSHQDQLQLADKVRPKGKEAQPCLKGNHGRTEWHTESESESRSVVSDSVSPCLCPWNSPGQHTGVGSLCLLQGIFPTQGSNQFSRTLLQVDSLPAEPQEKLKNTGVGSLTLLQWIFLTQEPNWGLLHCRRILHQMSYQGSPRCCCCCC